MTRDEAEKVAKILATADNGCSVCVRRICGAANVAELGWWFLLDERFPEVDEVLVFGTEEEYLAAAANKEEA